MKTGLKQTIHQGFQRLRRLHDALAVDYNKVQDTLEESEYDLKAAIADGEKECFMGQVLLPPLPAFGDFSESFVLEQALTYARHGPFVGETFTDSEQVKKQAEKRGHSTMPSMTLGTGYDFMKDKRQQRALDEVDQEAPYAQVIAFPCGPWSPLQALRAKDRRRRMLMLWRRKKHHKLVRFAVRMARRQLARGRRFIIENPSRSAAWKEVPALKALAAEPGMHWVEFDQCRFGLKGPGGGLHRKRTWVLTSSQEVADELHGQLCQGDHTHEHVIGGNVASLAGRYPPALAEAFVRGLERQFEKEGNYEFEVFFGEADGDEGDAALPLQAFEDSYDTEDDLDVDQANAPTRAQRQAVLRLHQNTGHRAPLRLAKALAIAGASPEVIKAAKELRCDVCHETKRPSSHRPSALTKPRQFGDQVHVDLVAVKDIHDETVWVMHGIDAASGYQVAQTMEAKTAEEVEKFFNVSWIPVLGAPKVVVSDCGPEFTSEKMQSCMAFHDIVLHHIPVESPWANGLAERAGASLKVIVAKLVKEYSCQGRLEVQGALAAAVDACNQDIGQAGYSPAQFVLGKQPRTAEEVIPNDLRLRLTTHSMIENTPSLARQAAMKEAARVALARMKYSSSLRRAEFSRARRACSWHTYQMGDIVFFYRQQKAAGGGPRGSKRKKLLLNQWHGPAMITALEGGRVPTAAYVAYKGNLTKCALEHLRPASSLERLAMTEWEEILSEAIHATGPHEGEPHGDDGDDGAEDPEVPDDGFEYEPTDVEPTPDEVVPEEKSKTRQEQLTFPYPFQAQDLIPMMKLASTPSSPMPSASPSRRTSQSSMPLQASMSRQTSTNRGGEDERLTMVPEEPPGASAACEKGAIDESETSQPVAGPSEEASASGRPLERAAGSVRRALSEGAAEEREAKRRSFVPLVLGGRSIDVMLAEQDTCIHPLLRAAMQAQDDLMNHYHHEGDHGSWDGRWSMPSRIEWEIFELAKWPWPS